MKDQASLLQATAAVLRRRPEFRANARVMIVGDGPLLAELRATADALGLGDITWLPGSSADVPVLLRAMDLFVLPSLNEGISNTILEAMATGLPVLASAAGGNVELVDDGVTGGLFPAGDVPALAALIERHLENAELRQREGAAARAKAEGRFSLPAMVRAYQAVYDRVR